MAVSRISVAKGSHCHATIRMIDNRGAWARKSKGSKPMNLAMWANSPLTGFMNMFFQTRAETVGITKNGAITRMRTIPWPHIGWSSRSANPTPPTMVMTRTPPTSRSVLPSASKKAGSVRKYS